MRSLLLLLLRVSSEVAAVLSIVFPTFKSSKKATSRFCSCESIVFRSSPSKRVQCFSYTKSSECCKGKPEAPSVVHLESYASHTPSTYIIPTAILGFAGIAAFLHYNDERRAIPIGIYDSSCGSILFQESHEDGCGSIPPFEGLLKCEMHLPLKVWLLISYRCYAWTAFMHFLMHEKDQLKGESKVLQSRK